MNRRDAITAVGWLLGGTIIGADLLINPTSAVAKALAVADKNQIAFLNEVGETILPATKTPGAKAANVGAFMLTMVEDCYTPKDRETFYKGLTQLDEACVKKNGKPFMQCNAKQRTELLTQLDNEQKEYRENKKGNHYFRMMKELTLLGFFTSEVGATQALRYEAVPGRYDGCMPYKKGDRAWA
ncbi:twin-arginine translocation pathway signal protein [Rufibacter radiotolerans]|uniref:Twin-arginine translocation pathway signal protein n=1 Tax=Rufibacter radiotolerans TaxID=1379910 RepID=A0A0H4W868_9BACT|nr:gluconate 2-dehydrogenase subunit 3 family protein [Rufibacter radiotolerans]AKQ46631.1 twin-arginine translocation pathway signal protein [Rufibacter radiotolerans]